MGGTTEQIDGWIKTTIKAMKQASAVQVWTWAANREGDLVAIEARLEELARAGMVSSIKNAFPAAYKMGRWR